MKVYLAGPMSGIPMFNYPAFTTVSAKLREQGYEVYNPSEIDDEEDQKAAMASADGTFASLSSRTSWGDFLARDVKIIADECAGVALLPGWWDSRGARLEAFVALQLGLPLFEVFNGVLEDMPADYALELIAINTLNQGDVSRYGGKK